MILLWLNLLLLLNMVNLHDQVKLISMLQRIKNLPFPKSLSLQFKFAYWCHIEDIRNNVRTTCNYVFTFIALKYDFFRGWGRIDTSTQDKSKWLLKANISEVPLSACQESYKSIQLSQLSEGLVQSQLCATSSMHGKVVDACQGR